jgi:carbon-monoxide dehydrogenase large subunit
VPTPAASISAAVNTASTPSPARAASTSSFRIAPCAKGDAPELHPEAPGNQTLDWELGDGADVDRLFAAAHHVTTLTLRNNRCHVSPMEPRAAVGEHDSETDHYTLHSPSQGVFGFTNVVARDILRIPRENLRVRTYDVGGSFGMKSAPYPEAVATLVAAKQLGRPVKWCDDRSDSFLSDQHGRDSYAEASLAFDADGRIQAGRVEIYCNVGAYLTAVGPSMHTRNVLRNFPGLYRMPIMHARTRAMFTNTTPIGAYRGAGRPEAVYYMERMMDTAAREMGIDRVELRRRNMITPEEIPYAAVSELTYDQGGLGRIRCATHGIRGERQAAGSRARGLSRGDRPARDRDGRYPLRGGRHGDDGLRVAELRPGASGHFRPDPDRPVGRPL